MSTNSVQAAHDELLRAMPEGASHVGCPMCHPGDGDSGQSKEVAGVVDERTFSQTEHIALLTDAVTRETAALTTAKEDLENQVSALQDEKASANSDLQAQIDVLEAEKANAEKAAADTKVEFETFKSELAEMAAVAGRRTERVSRIKAANSALSEDYFTDARADRWAQMAEETFEALVADITEAASATTVTPATQPADAVQQARETAAFTGGSAPTSGGGSSLFGQFLTATGHRPAPVA